MGDKVEKAGQWVEFLQPFNFTPAAERRVTTRYEPGMRVRVTKEAADRAIAAGKAKASTDPRATTKGPTDATQHPDKGPAAE